MYELIKFNWKYYQEVKDFLDSNDTLHKKANFGGDNHIYLTHKKESVNGTLKGLVLQKSCKPDEGIVYRINNHPCFQGIKKHLENITKEK